MKTKRLIILIAIAALLLISGSAWTVRRAVMLLPHIQVVNVASGCVLNSDPFGEPDFQVYNPSGALVFDGSEAGAVAFLIFDCQ